jgi:hypothetical protein
MWPAPWHKEFPDDTAVEYFGDKQPRIRKPAPDFLSPEPEEKRLSMAEKWFLKHYARLKESYHRGILPEELGIQLYR